MGTKFASVQATRRLGSSPARWAGQGSNLRPWAVVICTDNQTLNRLNRERRAVGCRRFHCLGAAGVADDMVDVACWCAAHKIAGRPHSLDRGPRKERETSRKQWGTPADSAPHASRAETSRGLRQFPVARSPARMLIDGSPGHSHATALAAVASVAPARAAAATSPASACHRLEWCPSARAANKRIRRASAFAAPAELRSRSRRWRGGRSGRSSRCCSAIWSVRRRRRSGWTPRTCGQCSRTTTGACGKSSSISAAPWRSSSATRWWRSSVPRSRTRTIPSGPSGLRLRSASGLRGSPTCTCGLLPTPVRHLSRSERGQRRARGWPPATLSTPLRGCSRPRLWMGSSPARRRTARPSA
jgi:hypothetical protein